MRSILDYFDQRLMGVLINSTKQSIISYYDLNTLCLFYDI